MERLTINFDIAAVIICMMLLAALMIKQLVKGRSNTLFFVLVLQIAVAGILDIITELYGPVFEQNRYSISTQTFLNYLYYYIHNFTAVTYVLYISSVLGIWHKIQQKLWMKLIIFLPYALDVVLLMINPINRGIFGFDDTGVYYRGKYIWILYLIAGYYMVLSVVIILINARHMHLFKIFILTLYVPISGIAIFAGMINPLWRMEIAAMAIMTVVVALSVQRPEEYMDPVVEALSSSAFDVDMVKYFSTGRPMAIMMIRLCNQLDLRKNVGVDQFSYITRRLSNMVGRICRIMGMHGDIYYLDSGVMCVVADLDKYDLLKDASRLLVAYTDEPLKLKNMEIKLEVRTVLARVPDEYCDFERFMEFAANFSDYLPDNRKMILLKDYIDTRDYQMRSNMDAIIARAINERELKMYYQPIYSLHEDKFVSAEALIRLIDRDYGFVSPGIFIPVAEKSGAIHKIGDFVNNDVCRFISSIDFKGLGLKYIELNLSVAQCIDPGLIDSIRDTMERYRVTCDQLNLEITETAVDYDPVITNRNILGLSKMGLSFSLDDYGTGYSNIARVATMPIDIVKIDKSLVDEIRNPMMWTIIQNTVSMLKKINKKILVEGVEDAYALSRFKELECDYIQGYYFSKPLPEDEFLRFIEEHNF